MKVKPPGRGKNVRSGAKNGQQREPAPIGLAQKNRPGQTARPTIIDVARLANVSPATVSNTLNGRPNVDTKTKERVQAAVKKLGYTPNLRARRLRTGRADTIAIFSSMSLAISGGRARLGFAMEIAAAAAVRAIESGIALILVPPVAVGQSASRDLHIDGALLVEPMEGDPEIAFLQQRGIPIVSIGRYPGSPIVPHVDIDPYRAARLLTAHLYDKGARHIGLIVGAQPRFTNLETERAYRDVAKAAGMRATVRRIDEAGGEPAGYEAALDVLTTQPELDSLFVSVDAFAAGARRAAAAMGRSMPGNLKMATRYDGVYAREGDPPLTAVNLHLDELAVMAVELLLEHIAGRTDRVSVSGPAATLVERGSSA